MNTSIISLVAVISLFVYGSHKAEGGKKEQKKGTAMCTPASILKSLDVAAQGSTYHMFLYMGNGYFLPCNARMHLYSDGSRWAMILEKTGYHNRNLRISTELLYFGNCLENLSAYRGETSNVEEFILCDESEMKKLSDDGSDNFELVASHTNFVRIRDSLVPIEKNMNAYKEKGIAIVDYRNPHQLIDFVSMMRLLAETHRPLFLATEAELRTCIPKDIPHILTVDEWYHEDMVKPSAIESYRKAAEVMSKQDAKLWKLRHKPNTHWKYWPEAGEL